MSTTILKREKPFEKLRLYFEDDRINKSIERDNKMWFHSESITIYSNVIIEPTYFYCLNYPNIFHLDTAFYEKLTPSLPKFLMSYFEKKKLIDECIIFDAQVGLNYFHFFSDVLSKIILVREHNVGHIPLLISKVLYEKHYFQYFLHSTNLFEGLDWVIIENEYIISKKTYVIKSMPYEKKYFASIRNSIHFERYKLQSNQRLFLTRSIESGRTIRNWKEIVTILENYNFQIVDSGKLYFDDQIILFSGVKYLVAIHGAGNVNITFSNTSLRFLEICPENRICSHYYWLANTLEIDYYDMILGGELSGLGNYPEGDFYLNPEKFKISIEKLLKN